MGDGRLRPVFFASVARSRHRPQLLPRPDAATASEGRQRRRGGPGGGEGAHARQTDGRRSAIEADAATATRGDVGIGWLDRLGSREIGALESHRK